MFQSSGKIYADEGIVGNTTEDDIDIKLFNEFIYHKFFRRMTGNEISV
jgi:hypothetical protein